IVACVNQHFAAALAQTCLVIHRLNAMGLDRLPWKRFCDCIGRLQDRVIFHNDDNRRTSLQALWGPLLTGVSAKGGNPRFGSFWSVARWICVTHPALLTRPICVKPAALLPAGSRA